MDNERDIQRIADIETRNIEDQIRDGIIITKKTKDTSDIYRAIFIEGNFFLYHLIRDMFVFQDTPFRDDHLMLVYSNITNVKGKKPPAVVQINAGVRQ